MRDQRDKPQNFKAIEYFDVTPLCNSLSSSNAIGAAALRFTILTAMRSGAVRLATWDQFDDNLSEWIIPEENMKGRKEFRVPLCDEVGDILRPLREGRSKAVDLVCPSPKNPQKPISENTMRKLLQTHYPEATVHGMRAAFRTWAAEVLQAPDDVAETALAHTVGSATVRAYNRTERFEYRRLLMEDWGFGLKAAGICSRTKRRTLTAARPSTEIGWAMRDTKRI